MSIPTIFTPFDYQGMQLVDGGLLDPIPIAATLHDHNDLTVAVSLNGMPDPELNRADPAPPNAPHLLVGQVVDPLAFEQYLAAGDAPRRLQKADDRCPGQGFSGAGLADHA